MTTDTLPAPFTEAAVASETNRPTDADAMFVTRIAERHVHPVMVFGTQSSGKSVLLHSLFAYARSAARSETGIKLGEPIFPSGYPLADKRQEAASQFFNKTNIDFAGGVVPPPDQREVPFFVPVNVTARKEQLNLAFLEGMGEWYERNENSPNYYNDFKDEIRAVLQHYPHPLSVLLVTPSVGQPGHPRDRSLECLANVITQYEQLRKNRSRDRILLLATMWDAFRPPENRLAGFSDTTPRMAYEEFSSWPFIWQAFARLDGLGPDGKSFMPYSAGWFTAGKTMQKSAAHQHIFDKFNRTVWNWLFDAASSARYGSEGDTKPAPLYPDVDVDSQPGAGVHSRMASAALWIRAREL